MKCKGYLKSGNRCKKKPKPGNWGFCGYHRRSGKVSRRKGRVRCRGITRYRGERCTHRSMPGKAYCKHHLSQSPIVKRKQCQAITTSGRRCRLKTFARTDLRLKSYGISSAETRHCLRHSKKTPKRRR